MKITLKDGSVKEYGEAKSVYEIAADISEGLARMATAGEVDGEVIDLRTVIDQDCELTIHTFQSSGGSACIPSHNITHPCAGSKETVPGYKACDRTGDRRWILL